MAGSSVVGYLRAILTLDSAEFESGAKRVSGTAKTWSRDLGKMGSQATAIGSSLTKVLTLPILGIGYAAVQAGASFEQTMNQVSAVTNASASDMSKLSAAATEWGAKTKFSNTEAAEAMLELGKAGFTADQTIAALPTTLQLATAANMGLGEAAQMTANIMNTFGLSATDLAHSNDILTEAANRSTIDVADLRESLKFVGPVAHIAGVSLADVAAASAVLGQNGIKAEMAGTGLRGMLSSLLAPSKDTKEMLDALGFSAELAAGKTVNWASMLDALHLKFGEGKDSADKYAGMVMEAFGKRAGPAVIAMATEGGAAIKELSASLDASQGSAARMTDAFMKGLPGAMEVAKGSMETMFASIETSLAPTLEKLLNVVAQIAAFVADTLVPAFNALPEPIKTGIVVLVGLAAAAGPVLVVLGSLFTAASSVAAAFTATGIATTVISAAMPVLGAALAVLTGPIGLIAAAIAALGAAWYVWGDDVKRIATEVFSAVKSYLWDKLEPVLKPIIGLLDSIGQMFVAFGKLVGAVVEKVYDVSQSWLVQKLGAAFETMRSVVETVVGAIGRVLGKVPDYLLPLLGPIGAVVLAYRHWSEITTIAQGVYTAVKTWLLDKFTAIVDGIKGKIDAVTGFFRDMYDKVVGHSYVPDMVTEIGQSFGQLGTAMVEPARSATASVMGLFSSMLEGLTTSMATGLGNALTGASTWRDAFVGVFDSLKSSVMSLFDSLISSLEKRAIAGFINMLTGAGSFSSAFSGMLGGAMSGFGGGVGPAMGVANGVSASTGVSGSALGGGGVAAGIGTAASIAGGIGLVLGLGAVLNGTGLFGGGSDATGYEQVNPNDPYGYQNSGMSAADIANAIANQGNQQTSGFTFGDQPQGGPQSATGTPQATGSPQPIYYPNGGGATPQDEWLWQGPSFKDGTGSQFLDFGAGTLAMLHGHEMITPEGSALSLPSGGGAGGEATMVMDGRAFARLVWPHLEAEVRRLQLTR